MIKIINNLKLLKVNKKELLDLNKIRNQTIEEIIKRKIDSLKECDLKNKVTVTINGNTESFTFEISSEDNETIKFVTEKLNV